MRRWADERLIGLSGRAGWWLEALRCASSRRCVWSADRAAAVRDQPSAAREVRMFRMLLRGGGTLVAASAIVASAGVLDDRAAAAAGKPQATTGAPSAITPTGATLNGTVNPNGAS